MRSTVLNPPENVTGPCTFLIPLKSVKKNMACKVGYVDFLYFGLSSWICSLLLNVLNFDICQFARNNSQFKMRDNVNSQTKGLNGFYMKNLVGLDVGKCLTRILQPLL